MTDGSVRHTHFYAKTNPIESQRDKFFSSWRLEKTRKVIPKFVKSALKQSIKYDKLSKKINTFECLEDQDLYFNVTLNVFLTDTLSVLHKHTPKACHVPIKMRGVLVLM